MFIRNTQFHPLIVTQTTKFSGSNGSAFWAGSLTKPNKDYLNEISEKVKKSLKNLSHQIEIAINRGLC